MFHAASASSRRPPAVLITALAATKGKLKRTRPPTEAALAQLFFDIADQLLKPLLRGRVRSRGNPASMFDPSFQFFSVALLIHCVEPRLHMTERTP